MSTRQDPERRIPSIDSDGSMPLWRGYTLYDALLVAMPFLIYIIIFQFIPAPLYLPVLGVMGLVSLFGVGVVLTAPEYYTSIDWLEHHVGHMIRANEYFNIPLQGDYKYREQREAPDHNPISQVFATDQRTQDVLGIERVIPSSGQAPGGVQMEDGSICTAIKIDPANLTLSTPQKWRNATTSLATTLNTLDYPIKIYQTNSEFDTERFMQPYRDRRTDDDILREPALEELLTAFNQWYPDRIESRNTTISEFYVIVGVAQPEVKSESRETGVREQLAETPGFSLFIDANTGEEIPESVVRGRQMETLYTRIDQLVGSLRQIEDINAKSLPAEENAVAIGRAWTRDEHDSDAEELFSNNPVVYHQSEREVNEAA
jgi:hypothetical protein